MSDNNKSSNNVNNTTVNNNSNSNHNIHNRISNVQNSNKTIKPPKSEKSKNALLHFVAGGLGGAAGVVCTSPLEVIKTQLQGARSSLLYIGKPRFVPTTFYSLYNLVLRDGARGLFKGLGPHLIGVAPARAVHFSTYSFTKSILERFGVKEGPIMYCTSAISAGCTVALVTSPIWLVKTRMQLQTSLKNFNQGTYYHNAFHCCLAVIREEGVFGFYKGLGASIIGVSESAFQFVLYEGFKKRIIEEKRKKSHKYPNPNELTTMEYLTAAGVAKLIAAVSTYPHEVVRTRLRENVAPGHVPKYTSVLQALYLIGKEEGVRGLFGGVGAHVLRVVPNSAIMFLTYEFVVDIWSSMTRVFSTK
ncbi:mitochondrial substrate carrier family protein [Heterostelium album PN500]|uniref:Mitochondrial substrate carrier family protein n=1 Tax=Heterostelium pallidum (strain ATCC 26659 / Pp 5 / PN500) TaxID=670386 RepID=D3B436_HETP5|nr:mitochondrial substrate carrier family protein [Heterostelium album PN500]EFA84084.1 mitochondrial substrate carrier family protein [Heterostelium album PN500]|eukprot:XP_020436201.1 mitochondrial substrate carrier family protein [Heterostelium album PN500]